jgi:hypothetical protein
MPGYNVTKSHQQVHPSSCLPPVMLAKYYYSTQLPHQSKKITPCIQGQHNLFKKNNSSSQQVESYVVATSPRTTQPPTHGHQHRLQRHATPRAPVSIPSALSTPQPPPPQKPDSILTCEGARFQLALKAQAMAATRIGGVTQARS